MLARVRVDVEVLATCCNRKFTKKDLLHKVGYYCKPKRRKPISFLVGIQARSFSSIVCSLQHFHYKMVGCLESVAIMYMSVLFRFMFLAQTSLVPYLAASQSRYTIRKQARRPPPPLSHPNPGTSSLLPLGKIAEGLSTKVGQSIAHEKLGHDPTYYGIDIGPVRDALMWDCTAIAILWEVE